MFSKKTAMERFTGKLTYTVIRNADTGFTVCEYTDSKTDKIVRVVGLNLPNVKHPVTFLGNWVNDPKFGLQFRVDTVEEALPDSSTDIIDFLSSLHIGIGKEKAKKMVSLIGEKDFWNTIIDHPERFLQIQGINENTIKKLKKATLDFRLRADLLQCFAGHLEMNGNQYNQIKNTFKGHLDTLIGKIKKNPYCLHLAGYHFQELDDFATFLGIDPMNSDRIGCALWDVLATAESKAHVGLPVSVASVELSNLLNRKGSFYTPQMCEQYVAFPETEWDIVFSNGLVYRGFSYDDESSIVDCLSEFLKLKPPEIKTEQIQDCIMNFESERNISLAPEQKDAVIGIMKNRVSILTGGPGTGKSTILDAVLYCWEKIHNNKNWILLSPTGIAARRMTDRTGENAYTIHSALGLRVDDDSIATMLYSEEYITQQLSIIDESSMLDQSLASAFLRAIQHKAPQVVFVGDSNQLPSVKSGNVLADMIASNVIPTFRLSTIFRQASDNPIPVNAKKINSGNTDLLWNRYFRGGTYGSDEANIEEISQFYKRCVDAYGIKNVILLTPFRRDSKCSKHINTEFLNKKLQNMVNPDCGQASIKHYNTVFRVGDRVMQNKNTDTVKNGDIGIIKSIRFNGSPDNSVLTVEFDAGEVEEYEKNRFSQLELAYALTIHKSQGSEYKTVLMLLGYARTPFLRRNLLYTGMTRAKENFAIFSPIESIQYAINNNQTDIRYTNLCNRLIQQNRR